MGGRSCALGAFLPGLAALGLASLYGVGALLWTTELQGAKVRVSNTLPLIPLEQVLARGILTGVVAGIIFPALLFAALRIARAEQRMEQRDAERKRALDEVGAQIQAAREALAAGNDEGLEEATSRIERGMPELLSRKRRRWVSVALVLIGVSLLLTVATPLEAGLLGAVAATWIPWLRAQANTVVGSGRLLPIIGGTAAAVILAAAFLDPAPLPRVDLTVSGGGEVSGQLVVATGDAYYVTTGENRIQAVPSQQIRAASITQREGERSTVAELVTGWDWL